VAAPTRDLFLCETYGWLRVAKLKKEMVRKGLGVIGARPVTGGRQVKKNREDLKAVQ